MNLCFVSNEPFEVFSIHKTRGYKMQRFEATYSVEIVIVSTTID